MTAFERTCDNTRCGKRYIAQTKRSRFCRPACRVYAHSHGTARAPEPPAAVAVPEGARTLPDAPDSVASVLPAPAAGPPAKPEEVPGSVTSAVEKALADAHRSGTVPGQLARVLAMRLDNSRGESGAGLSSLAKHLESLMISALAGAPAAPDELDELEARRQAKLDEAAASA